MFANLSQTSSGATIASTPGEARQRRRIRCKMCRYVVVLLYRALSDSQVRQELATREHMLDHGQLGPSSAPLATKNSQSVVGDVSPSFLDPQIIENEQEPSPISEGVSAAIDVERNIEEVISLSSTTSETRKHVQISTNDPAAAAQLSKQLRTRQPDVGATPVAGISGGSLPILLNPKCSGYFVEPVSPPTLQILLVY